MNYLKEKMKSKKIYLFFWLFLFTTSCSTNDSTKPEKKNESFSFPKTSCERALYQSEKTNDKIEPLLSVLTSQECISSNLKGPTCASALKTVCDSRKELTLITDKILSQCDAHPKKYLTDMLGANNRKTVRLLNSSC